MSHLPLLVLLLLLSYVGSFLVAGGRARGGRPKAGIEFIALGFVLGPRALDLVGSDMLAAFDPVVQVALGWLAFTVGLDFGYSNDRRIRTGSLALGTFAAVATGTAVAAAVWFAGRRLHSPGTVIDRLLLAGGIGAAGAMTAPHAVPCVLEGRDARGPLAERLDEISHAGDLLPLLAVALLFALEPATSVGLSMPIRDWPILTTALGLVLGAGAALLVRSDLPQEESWAVLFGVSLIAIGTSARLGISTLTASFFMGIAVSALSRHHRELRAMVAPTERPVLLPALLIAGARLDFRASPLLPWLAAAAILARVIVVIVVGWAVAMTWKPARRAGAFLGLALLPCGTLSMSIGLAFALRFPGSIGDGILVMTAVAATVGEFVGLPHLRRALHAAGELDDPPRSATSREAAA